jgi:hypothetical protein
MGDVQDAFNGKLYNKFTPEWEYSDKDKYRAQLLDQYKLYVDMADRIAARRQTANSYFLSVNVALLGFIGYLTTKDEPASYLWLLGIAGVTLSYGWQRLILSYKGLSTAKYEVIHAIEKRLPISPYDAEWEALGRGEDEKKYKPFTHIELHVPWVFVALHAFVILRTIRWKALWDVALSLFGVGR